MALSQRMQNELLEGRLPRNTEESDFMDFYGWTLCPTADRPKKLTKCHYCGREWEQTGWPAPKRMIGQYDLNTPMETTDRFIFLFSRLCSVRCQELETERRSQKKADDPLPEEPDRF